MPGQPTPATTNSLPPLQHQNFQGAPNFSEQAVDPTTGVWTVPWQRFFINIWQRLGGSRSSLPAAAYLQQVGTGDGDEVTVHDALTGDQIGPGPIAFGTVSGGAPVAVPIGASPATVVAAGAGTIISSGATQVEFARPPAGFITVVSAVGGAVPVVAGDQVRLTWGGAAPTVTFFPTLVT